jgi:hypothetical protein
MIPFENASSRIANPLVPRADSSVDILPLLEGEEDVKADFD